MLPWSACWFFAAFTGVLLWLSSLFAAWMDNWFVLHQLGPALANHRGSHRWFGPTRARHMAVWLERNIAGLAGNISLGLMLGIIPVVAVFFGLPLDVRHVTLSTGQVTAAFAALGGEHFLETFDGVDCDRDSWHWDAESVGELHAGIVGGDPRAKCARAGTAIILPRLDKSLVAFATKFCPPHRHSAISQLWTLKLLITQAPTHGAACDSDGGLK